MGKDKGTDPEPGMDVGGTTEPEWRVPWPMVTMDDFGQYMPVIMQLGAPMPDGSDSVEGTCALASDAGSDEAYWEYVSIVAIPDVPEFMVGTMVALPLLCRSCSSSAIIRAHDSAYCFY